MRWQRDRNRRLTKAAEAALLSLFYCCGLGLLADAARGAPQSTVAQAGEVNSHFAIADFDGDRIPDLATVQTQGANSSAHMRYSIRFQLTAGAPQVIDVTAPAGGLQIVARDVNGDKMLDLLVSTEWLHQPVAILLNDGHGKFTVSDPGAWRGILCTPEPSWSLAGMEIKEAAEAMLSRNSSKNAALRSGFSPLQEFRGTRASAISHRVDFPEAFSSPGRAPPSLLVFKH